MARADSRWGTASRNRPVSSKLRPRLYSTTKELALHDVRSLDGGGLRQAAQDADRARRTRPCGRSGGPAGYPVRTPGRPAISSFGSAPDGFPTNVAASHVPESGEALGRLGVHPALRLERRLGALGLAVDRKVRAHAGGDGGARLDDVLRLLRIVDQAVELGPRGLDELEAFAAKRVERRPAIVEASVEALGVGLVVGNAGARQRRPGNEKRRSWAAAGSPRSSRAVGDDVDAPELPLHPRLRREAGPATRRAGARGGWRRTRRSCARPRRAPRGSRHGRR